MYFFWIEVNWLNVPYIRKSNRTGLLPFIYERKEQNCYERKAQQRVPLNFFYFRKEKELESKIRAPAEAEKYRLEKIAEAEKARVVLEAEAIAEARALKVR